MLLALLTFACDAKNQQLPSAPSPTLAETARSVPVELGAKTINPPNPDLALPLQSGKTAKLSDYRGKQLVLYFYPKDDTPGCRVEAQGFRDLHEQFVAKGVVVLGVSTQDAASHQAFMQKEGLPFDLVVDTDGAIASAFGVPLLMGTLASRQTVLLDAQGVLKKKWDDVTPADHPSEVLAAID